MIPERWYPVLEAAKLRRKPVGLRRLGRSLVLFRDGEGKACGLPATCPHRGAALELGRVVAGEIECPWHGFRFAPDGRCTGVPCAGRDQEIPRTLDLEPALLREEHGLLWLWYGERESARGDLPFFEDAGDPRGTAETSYILPYHYTRMVETNLDIHHTAFVHRKIMPGVGKRVVDFEAFVDGDRVCTRGELRDEGKTKGMAFRVDALLPCLGFVELTSKLRFVVGATPIDENQTWVWFRYYQDYSRLPGLRWLLSWIAVQSELRFVQPQDWRIFASLPPGTIDDVPYRFVQADQGIALYRKLRQRALAGSSVS